MERLGIILARHPHAVAAFFGALTGICGYNAFRAGMTYAQLRAAVAESDRVASEALGG
jgi:hypothetical protein